MQKRDGTDQIRAEADWERTRFSPPIDRAICPSINTHHQQSIDNNNATSIAKRPIPNTTVSERDKFDHQFLTPDEFGIFRDPDGYAKAMDGRTLHVSREDIADILQTANEADNLFMHHRINPEQKATNEFYDTAGGIDNNFIQNFAIQLKHRSTKFYWEEKDEYGVYRDDRRYARDLDGNTIRLHNTDIRRVLERASRDEPSYICLHEHANLFTQTKLVPEIYTKDKINEMFYGVCGEHEKNKEAFQMKLDGVYYPLNDSISWFTTCMEEMKQNIAIIQHATDVARPIDVYDPIPVKTPHTISRRINDPGIIAACHCGEDYETDYLASIETHTATSINSGHQKSNDIPHDESVDSRQNDWDSDYYNPIMAVNDAPAETPIGEFGIFRDPDGYAKAIDGRTVHQSRTEGHKKFYDTAGGIDNNFIQKSRHPTQTSVDFAVPTSVDRQPEFGRRAYDLYGNKKFYWEEKDEYGVYKDDRRYARDLDENTIRLHNTDIRGVLERASRDEPSYICLHEHANMFTQTKLVPEIYTKDEINEMFYGVCGEHEKNKETFQMKLDGFYYPLNDSISWLTTCMEEMKQNIARIQHATDVTQPPSIDKRRPPSIDDSPPRPHTKKFQKDFHTREGIEQLIEEIYRALETTEERLDGRCDDIYFPMDLSISGLTSKIEAIQTELVEIQSYIARRPEASLSIDRRNNISTDIHHQTSVDDATNRGRLVPKMTSDMSDTHYHGEEISAATFATLRRHQFNLENLEERLQRMESTTVTMNEKWRRGDEAIREFTNCTKDTKVDQPVNYPLLLRLFRKNQS
ncbi:hypothetical protein DY000_02052554 [Brassica cretica]|uniref:Uncharacterized protein n=1 Tax=Brassica cretica TaxID=69181 RepID=A0ABQ7A7U6_BRACR|nr:hypothetical protein DY000_02052554 [Brassica cretica]